MRNQYKVKQKTGKKVWYIYDTKTKQPVTDNNGKVTYYDNSDMVDYECRQLNWGFDKFTETQDKERCKLCGVEYGNFAGGCARFGGMTYKTLKKLVDKGYADISDNTNDSTALGEYLEFMEEHPRFKAHGYIVSNDRDDRRITIEGLEAKNVTINEMVAFTNFDRFADEFEATQKYCWSWWD